MTTDKTLPVVAWRRPSIYAECLPVFTPLCSEAEEWDEEGHQVTPLADHAAASARIAELEAQVRELRAAFGKHVRELFRVRDSWQVQALRQALWDAYVQHPEGTVGYAAGKAQYEAAIAAIDAAMEEKGE